MSSCNCMLSGSEIAANTSTNGCDDHAKLMTHMSLRNSVAGEHHLGFPSRYVGVIFVLTLITCQNHLGSRLVNLEDLSSKITSSKPAVFSLFVVSSCFVSFIFSFFLETQDLFDLMELATTLKYQVANQILKKERRVNFMPRQ